MFFVLVLNTKIRVGYCSWKCPTLTVFLKLAVAPGPAYSDRVTGHHRVTVSWLSGTQGWRKSSRIILASKML